MKAQDEVQKSDLFPILPIIQDDIEQARTKMRGFANNPATITTQHLLARQNLLSALRDGIPSDQNPSSTLNEIERIEGVLSELSEEVELNKSIRIDPALKDSGDLGSMTARINDAKQRISSDLVAAQRTPEIVAFIADQKRAREQGEVNAQIKKGKLQLLQDKIGSGFNKDNSNQREAINLIYDFNEAQDSAISQLSDDKETKAIFNILANHPEVIGDRSLKDVIESAREGYKIVHNALSSKGSFRNMGNWTAEEPKIMDKLLPKLCLVDVSQLQDSAAKITEEYAESIWANANYSAAAAVAGGARSITDKGLSLVASKTFNAITGQHAEDKPQQRGVLQGAYEAARKAVPNPFARRAGSSAPTTPEPEPMPAPPEPQQYQEECALAAQLFESAMTNTIELQTLAENGCFGLQGKIAGAVSPKELEELKAQVSHMRGLAAQAASLVQEASDGVAEISLNVSEDLVNIGAKLEGRLAQADQSATHILSAEDLFSDKPLPTTSLSEGRETQSSNDLTEGLQRARELQSISRNIESLNLPGNARAALESISAVLTEADSLLESRIPTLEAEAAEVQGKQAAEVEVAKPESRSLLSSLPSLPSFFRGKPTPAEAVETTLERLVAAKNAEELAFRANSWRYNPKEKAGAAASASADAAGQYALEGLRSLSGGVTVVALTTAAESARLAKRYPKAAAAAGAVYGAAKIAMAIVAAAPYVAAAAATGAALRTETGRAVAGQMVEGAAIVGGAAVGVAVNNPKATGVVAGAVGVIGAGLALAAAAPYAAALAAANTKVGKKVVGAVAKGVKEGAAVSALAQLEGGVGSVAAVENAVDRARSVAATARQVGDTARSFVGGEAAAGAPSPGSPEPSTPPRSRTSIPTGRS